MEEKTKYNNYRFVGKININEIQPWFDFDRGKPWDEREVPWPLENKVRREILITLANEGKKSFEEIYNYINFSPKPLLITKKEYKTKLSYQWDKEVLENHLLNLELYNLIKKIDEKYMITFPVLSMERQKDLDEYVNFFAQNWTKILIDTKDEILEKFQNLNQDKSSLYQIILEKVTDRIHTLLKQENLLPNTPNIKTLWAEQLRKIKFEKWLEVNF